MLPTQIQGRLVSYLLHLLSERCEHLIAFGQRALELFKLVHVQRKLGNILAEVINKYQRDFMSNDQDEYPFILN